MKTEKISNRNTMFSQKLGISHDLNLGLLEGKVHNFIIDTGLGSGSVLPILEAITDKSKPIIAVNTHGHWDHIWGNFIFREHTIVSHTSCYQFEDETWEIAFEKFKHLLEGTAEKQLPTLTFEDKLFFPEDGVELFFSPGHSHDSISVYDSVDKILYAGDNIGDTEAEIVPYIDTDLETFEALIEQYAQYDFSLCISGHNVPQGKEVIERMKRALPLAWKKQQEEGPPEE